MSAIEETAGNAIREAGIELTVWLALEAPALPMVERLEAITDRLVQFSVLSIGAVVAIVTEFADEQGLPS